MKMLYEYKLDISAEIAYARKWAFGRNPAFTDFEELGGDCTNFVSQCIYAGGAVMNYTPDFGWYYISVRDRAAAWTGVEFFYRFVTTNKEEGPFGEPVQLSEAQAGDVVQLGSGRSFYHSLFVVDTEGGIRVASHSYDAFGKRLSDYDFKQARCIHIIGSRKRL
jgi:hypothetical protein